MSKYGQKYSPNMDQTTYQLDEVVQEDLVKVYPYELSNVDDSRAFVQDLTTTIAYISQYSFTNTKKHSLKIDEKGNYYFEVLSDQIQQVVLDESDKDTNSKELKVEPTMTLTSNQFYDANFFKPMIAVIGSPISLDNGISDKDVFVITNITSSNDFNTEEAERLLKYGATTNELFEFDLIHINSIETQYTNSRVLFTTHEDMNKDVSTFDGQKGISLGIQSHSLIGSIKASGILEQFDKDGNAISTEYGDIDLISNSENTADPSKPFPKWAPFKMTPTSADDRVSMFADWFDYDSVMPIAYANKFEVLNGLDSIITNPEDLKMVQDMLIVSAGFASSWDSAPVLTTGTDAGKIKPDFRVGYSGIKVSVIAGKDPIKVVDGIYENHLRKEPLFISTPDRYIPVKTMLNALSRYIYSSYCIGKGQNSYNQVYLPWYLEALKPIDYKRNDQGKITPLPIPNPDAGGAGDVDTYILSETITFQSKSIYFNNDFSSNIPHKGQATFILPNKINMSIQKIVQTDRKLTLPQVPVQISAMNKLPLPGDIDTRSSQDLSYIWYLPIKNQTLFEEFMLNKTTTHNPVPIGTKVPVQLPRGVDGKVWTREEAEKAILAIQPGTITTQPQIDNPEGKSLRFKLSSPDGSRLDIFDYQKNRFLAFGTNTVEGFRRIVAQTYGYEDLDSIKVNATFPVTTYVDEISKITHSTFSEAIVTTTSQSSATISLIEGREILFDKQKWEEFLITFGIVLKGINNYKFDTYDNFRIKQIDEIIISSMWGNEMEIHFGTGPKDKIKIDMINKDNETLSIQKIIFT